MGDTDYRSFDTGAIPRNKLELYRDIQRYLHEKFTSYVKDKAIQESVLKTNPVLEVKCLKSPEINDYLDETFDSLGKSYGRKSDGILSK